ncbi:hypothetical protein MSAR_38290 [Mycolicibacterium sarraceniae]|uniref:Uncharacterized protein n=1 Tax=Mycolicibacterium sarraceniae TaxID=1534348 RepID=A0A7I7SVE0_9MYCO|nr:hypothetical protein MSAR_38290 [Mycolicibacterium sarraceniae]
MPTPDGEFDYPSSTSGTSGFGAPAPPTSAITIAASWAYRVHPGSKIWTSADVSFTASPDLRGALDNLVTTAHSLNAQQKDIDDPPARHVQPGAVLQPVHHCPGVARRFRSLRRQRLFA